MISRKVPKPKSQIIQVEIKKRTYYKYVCKIDKDVLKEKLIALIFVLPF